MFQKSTDPNSKSDKRVNKRGEEYNRAVVTVKQNQKEKELAMGMMEAMMQQQRLEQTKSELANLVTELTMKQKLLDAQMMQQQPLPQMPQAELPSMGAPPMDMGMGMPVGQEMPMPPPQGGYMPMEQGMPIDMGMQPPGVPGGDYMMPPMI